MALGREGNADGDKAEVAVEQLQFPETLLDLFHGDRRAGVVGEDAVDFLAGQDGVALEVIGIDAEGGGVGFGTEGGAGQKCQKNC